MSDRPRRAWKILKWTGLIILLLILGGSILMNLALITLVGGTASPEGEVARLKECTVEGAGPHKAALIAVKGVISRGYGETLIPGRGIVGSVLAQLKRATADKEVRAVILEIDSPGGSVGDSDLIYHEVQEVRKSGKPVVASLQDMATSGAYYIAVASDRIIAQPTTITGNIGVLLQGFNVEGLFQKVGLKEITIKKGRMKDILSPTRSITPEEEQLLQGIADSVWYRFASLVAAGRNLNKAQMEMIADGRIYLAPDALKAGLIDAIGYRDDALAAASELTGMPRLKLIRYEKPFSFKDMLTSSSLISPPSASLFQGLMEASTPRLMYLWTGR
ncbi:MAG: signal peptide peptidase SppA [Candidatus Aureabacteria bacterium]|nr:signal peptide peptidase SppA [Candidatus Auribacterota bacterium]